MLLKESGGSGWSTMVQSVLAAVVRCAEILYPANSDSLLDRRSCRQTFTKLKFNYLRNLKAALCLPHPFEHDKAIKTKVNSLKRKRKVREKANI